MELSRLANLSNRKVPFPVTEYAPQILRSDLGFQGILVHNLGYVPQKVLECGDLYKIIDFDCGHSLTLPIGCGERVICHLCALSESKLLARDATNVVKQMFAALGWCEIRFAKWDFTLPESARHRVTWENCTQFMRVGEESIRDFLGLDRDKVPFIQVAFQANNSDAPDRGWFAHLHCTVLGFLFNKRFECFDRLNAGYRNKDDIARMRLIYRKNFERVYGNVNDRREWNVFYGYGKSEAQLFHWERYLFRKPIEDIYRAYCRGRYLWNSVYPNKWDGKERWFNDLVTNGHHRKLQRVRYYGGWGNNVVYDYLDKMGLENFPRRKERMKKLRELHCLFHPLALYNTFVVGVSLAEAIRLRPKSLIRARIKHRVVPEFWISS